MLGEQGSKLGFVSTGTSCGNKAYKALSSSRFANKLLVYSRISYWQIDKLVVVRLLSILM